MEEWDNAGRCPEVGPSGFQCQHLVVNGRHLDPRSPHGAWTGVCGKPGSGKWEEWGA